MLLNILADECVDFRIVSKLRSLNFNVISILEEFHGVDDKTVLKVAVKNKALLITEDSDFGEWIFAHKEKSTGVIFLRYKSAKIDQIIPILISVLNKYNSELYNKFVVVTTQKIRMRNIPD